jgi:hypothetical protein
VSSWKDAANVVVAAKLADSYGISNVINARAEATLFLKNIL